MQWVLPLALLFLFMKILHGAELEGNGSSFEADKEVELLQVERPIRACSLEASHFKTTGSEEGFRNHFRRSRRPSRLLKINLNPVRKTVLKRAFMSDGFSYINSTETGSRIVPQQYTYINNSKISNNSTAQEKRGFFKFILKSCFSKDRKSSQNKTDGSPKNFSVKSMTSQSGKELESSSHPSTGLQTSTALQTFSAVTPLASELSSKGGKETSPAEGTDELLDYEHNPDMYPDQHPFGSGKTDKSAIDTTMVKKITSYRRVIVTSPKPDRDIIERVQPVGSIFSVTAPAATAGFQIRRFESFHDMEVTESEANRVSSILKIRHMKSERNRVNEFQNFHKYIDGSTKHFKEKFSENDEIQIKSQRGLSDFKKDDVFQKFLPSSTTGIYKHFKKYSVSPSQQRMIIATRDYFREDIFKKHFEGDVTTTTDELEEKMAKNFKEKNRKFFLSDRHYTFSKPYTESSLHRNSRRIFLRPNRRKALRDRIENHFRKGKGYLKENDIIEKSIAKYFALSDDFDSINTHYNRHREPKKSAESELLHLCEVQADEEERMQDCTTSLRESNCINNRKNLLAPRNVSVNGFSTPPIVTQNLDTIQFSYVNKMTEKYYGGKDVRYNTSSVHEETTGNLIFTNSPICLTSKCAVDGSCSPCNGILSSKEYGKAVEDYLITNGPARNKSKQNKYFSESKITATNRISGIDLENRPYNKINNLESGEKLLAQWSRQNAFESSKDHLRFLNHSVPKNFIFREDSPDSSSREPSDLSKNPNNTQPEKMEDVFKVLGDMRIDNFTLVKAVNALYQNKFAKNQNDTINENMNALKFTESTKLIKAGNEFRNNGLSRSSNNSELEPIENVLKLIRDMNSNSATLSRTGNKAQQKISTISTVRNDSIRPELVKQYIVKELESLKEKSQNQRAAQNPLLLSYEATHFERLADILSAMRSSLLLKGVLNTVNLGTDVRPKPYLNKGDLFEPTKYSSSKERVRPIQKTTTVSSVRRNTPLSKLCEECPNDLEMSFTLEEEEDETEFTCPLELQSSTKSTTNCKTTTTTKCSPTIESSVSPSPSTKDTRTDQTSRTSTCSPTSTTAQMRKCTLSTNTVSCTTETKLPKTTNCLTSQASTGTTSLSKVSSQCENDNSSKTGEVCKEIINTLLQYITTLCPSDLTLQNKDEAKIRTTQNLKKINSKIEKIKNEVKNEYSSSAGRNVDAVTMAACVSKGKKVCTCRRESFAPLGKTSSHLSTETESLKNNSVSSNDVMKMIMKSLDTDNRKLYPNITIFLNDLTKNSSQKYIYHGNMNELSEQIEKGFPLRNQPQNTFHSKLTSNDQVFNENKWKPSHMVLEKGNNVARVKLFLPNTNNNSVDLSLFKSKVL